MGVSQGETDRQSIGKGSHSVETIQLKEDCTVMQEKTVDEGREGGICSVCADLYLRILSSWRILCRAVPLC